MKVKALLLSLLITLLVFSPGCLDDEKGESGDVVPSFSLTADDGEEYSSESLLGEAYVLHFSASWCNNCRPTMHAVSNQLNDSLYIVVSTDSSDAPKLSDWHLQVNDSKEDSSVSAPFSVSVELSKSFEISNTPTLILIDRDGIVIDKHIGPLVEQQEIDSFWAQLE
ncbi:MAG: TlpA disulfide reductase family protein [Candidatus Poseidoniales archaeon]|nr:TlpA disulfide reductase family protein [Candidatus Poseidoniales archaeon]